MLKKFRRNPYLVLFIGLALVCCISLSVLFTCITVFSVNKTQTSFYQEKLEMLVDDWENQIQQCSKIALKVGINRVYYPSSFKNNYHDEVVLEDMKQYANYSSLFKEFFLFYQGAGKVYTSEGYTADLQVYLRGFSTEENEKMFQYFSEETHRSTGVFPTREGCILIFPIRFHAGSNETEAFLGFYTDYKEMSHRIQTVSGGRQGAICLFRNEELLYKNSETICQIGEKNIQYASTSGGEYTFCGLPEKIWLFQMPFSVLQIILLLISILLLLMFAYFCSRESYKPLWEMIGKYHEDGKEHYLPDDIKAGNPLEVLDYTMENMVQRNISNSQMLIQKRAILQDQFLGLLLSGNVAFAVQPYLERSQLRLPGPYFYVISIVPETQGEEQREYLSVLKEALEQLSSEKEGRFVYVLRIDEQKRFNVVCSITEETQEKDLTAYIGKLVNSSSCPLLMGVGRVYESLQKLSASWLESMDNLHEKNRKKENVFELDSWSRFFSLLRNGDKKKALEEFDMQIRELECVPASVLMQQYIFSIILGEFVKTAESSHVEISNQNLAMLVSSRNIPTFKESMYGLIDEFCEKRTEQKKNEEREKSYKIYMYINEHFAEYDLSIERVAEECDASTRNVRQAVLEHSGKMYKEYVIALKVDYAKKLLLEGEMSVADVCKKVGYENVSYFVKLFKKHTGELPSDYKGKIKKQM